MWDRGVGECGGGRRGLSGGVAGRVGWGAVQCRGWTPEVAHSAALPLPFLSTRIHCCLEVIVQSSEDQEKPGRI